MKPSHLRSLVRLYLLEELKALGNPAISKEFIETAEKRLLEENFTPEGLELILSQALRASRSGQNKK